MTSFDELKLAIYESGVDYEDACELVGLLESCDTVDEFVDVSEAICNYLEGAEDDADGDYEYEDVEDDDFEESVTEEELDEYCEGVAKRISNAGANAATYLGYQAAGAGKKTGAVLKDLSPIKVPNAAKRQIANAKATVKHVKSQPYYTSKEAKKDIATTAAIAAGAAGAGIGGTKAVKLKMQQMKLKGQLKELTATLGETINPIKQKSLEKQIDQLQKQIAELDKKIAKNAAIAAAAGAAGAGVGIARSRNWGSMYNKDTRKSY